MNSEHVHHLFAQVALATAGATAVETGRRQVTYGELRVFAGRLAAALGDLGAGKGSVVGIFSADPIEVIAAVLATLEIGGIFCPFDPRFPQRRLAAQAEVAAPQLFMTCSEALEGLKSLLSVSVKPVPVLVVDDRLDDDHSAYDSGLEITRLSDLAANDAAPASLVMTSPDDPCSIYFTSGSTGQPKAILGRLQGIAHFARWQAELLGVGPGTRVSQLASPAFDGFLKDVFVPLCAGGVACAPESRDVLLEPSRLIDWVDIEGIEVLHLVPSVLRAMLNQTLDEKYFAELRWVVLAGEALLPADVRRWREIFDERIGLVNLYGPTETTVTKLFHVVEPDDAERPSVPIGKPMPGCEVLIVSSKQRRCRPGMVGEIYLRTPYRSLGYYRDEAATSAAFVPNPLATDSTDIVYKTGDFGRWRTDGSVEFLGRRDQQVKIRGVRVELGELENLLLQHGGVRDVAVIDRDDGKGTKHLCAYLVLAEGLGVSTVREYLASRLPEAMVPSSFVELEVLPRTLNGKIDRQALPSLDQARAARGDDLSRGARTPVEEIVGGMWSEVLRLPEVGVDESFFELGGHSLLATQIISRVGSTFGVDLPLRTLFETPTVAGLAARIEQTKASGESGKGVALVPVDRSGDLPLSYSQQRMWLLEQLSAGSAAFHIPLGMRLHGALDRQGLGRTFTEIVRRHEMLRTTFPSRNGQPVQVVGPAGPTPLPVIDLSDLTPVAREAELCRRAAEGVRISFDLASGPLIRVALYRMAVEEHVIACTMHHLAGDAWSFEVLVGELSILYELYHLGKLVALPELAIQYGDYAVWQRRWLSGEELESRVSYWRQKLAGAPERLTLPQSRPRATVQRFRGARQAVTLDAELTAQLRALSRQEASTSFMTLLTGFYVLLYQYTGQDDLVVGSVIANRDRAEVERLIGFLANTLVLRADLSGGLSFREALSRVREMCLDAYAHQMPPEKLFEELGEDRGKGGGQRLFDVWFQMEKRRSDDLRLSGLDWEPFETPRENARFELSLILEEGDDRIDGEIEYDVDLFDSETIDALGRHLRAVLEQMVASPDGAIAGVSLADQNEAAKLSHGFSVNLET